MHRAVCLSVSARFSAGFVRVQSINRTLACDVTVRVIIQFAAAFVPFDFRSARKPLRRLRCSLSLSPSLPLPISLCLYLSHSFWARHKQKDEASRRGQRRNEERGRMKLGKTDTVVQCAPSRLIFQRASERRRDWSGQAARNVRIFRRVRRFSCKYVV